MPQPAPDPEDAGATSPPAAPPAGLRYAGFVFCVRFSWSFQITGDSFTATRHWPAARECGRIHNNAEVFVMSTAKEELSRLIQGQPEDSSREEIVRELAFHVMVERGLADSDAKRTISNEEMGRRIRSWRVET